jgi:beta-glucosidase
MAETESIKYKDPNQPVAVRVKDLLGRMSLEEKVGQMVQIDRSMANAEVMKSFFIGKNHFLYQSFYLHVESLMGRF